MLVQASVFFDIIRKILNEFNILNEYFSGRYKSSTSDYDIVFLNWTKDMHKRYKDFPLSMHWATSSPLISKNQLLFNIRHFEDFFCEVKYKFDEKFIKAFPGSIKRYMDSFFELNNRFQEAFSAYDKGKFTKISDFEIYFQDWKKNINLSIAGTLIDIRWVNNLELVVLNPVYFEIMMADDCTFEARYTFSDARSSEEVGA
jgi:hypothetical protein